MVKNAVIYADSEEPNGFAAWLPLGFNDNKVLPFIVSYLETNKEINVPLYEHFGFELSKKEMIPKSPVMHYAMVRNPNLTNTKEL